MSINYREAVAAQPVKGALAGTAAGVALALGGSTLVPGVALPVMIAMGAFYGAFNGGLIGVVHRLQGR